MRPSLKTSIFALGLITIVLIGLVVTQGKASSYYNNCGTSADVKPTSITEYCADAGAGVTDIKWSKWTTTFAEGTGSFYINGCDPTCAGGTIYKTNANVLLTGLTKTHGKNYLLNVEVSPAQGTTFSWPPKMTPVPSKVTWVTDLWRG